MARSKSSRRWLDRHLNDGFVRKAQAQGYRSRAAYKLLEIHQRDRIFRPGMCVVDLGAAPGGWSQVASELVGQAGRVLAIDLLPIDPISGVEILRGDFREEKVLERVRAVLGGSRADLVMSDMAPNLSGMKAVDQPRQIGLCELALEFAELTLGDQGSFVVKVFQGEGFDQFLTDVRGRFRKVVSRKPSASRAESRELYLVASTRKL